MIDIEEEDQSTPSFHAQGAQLAKGREDLIRRCDGLVVFSRLLVAHVAEDGGATCRLPKRSIVSLEESAKC